MTIRFVRIVGQPDRIYVKRTDGSETAWDFPTLGGEIPHDMVHLVVESMFDLRKGFWGRVDAGVDPRRVNEMASRKGTHKYDGYGDDLHDLFVAEILASLMWQMRELTPADRLAAFLSNCEKQSLTPPPQVTEESLAAVEQRLNELRRQWRALAPKGTLELTFA